MSADAATVGDVARFWERRQTQGARAPARFPNRIFREPVGISGTRGWGKSLYDIARTTRGGRRKVRRRGSWQLYGFREIVRGRARRQRTERSARPAILRPEDVGRGSGIPLRDQPAV